MTPLGRRIARQIATTGPMSLTDYMAVCMTDPRDGYYVRREAIGAEGDFITAPEISQMFGEIIGVWCVAAWQALGRPPRFVMAEAGPGGGTLTRDLLRATANFADFTDALDLVLIEASPAMIDRQRSTLAGSNVDPAWVGSLQELPDGPLILVANEFLDVLPIRQYVKSGAQWRERCVGLDEQGNLAWRIGPGIIDPAVLPTGAQDEPEGAVFETSPAREAWLDMLSERLGREHGAALLIDYGHTDSGFGETFQAVKAHQFVDPLAEPGLADLTAHVDFEALARVAQSAGNRVSPVVTQGDFLLAMGILERAGRLGAGADPAKQDRIRGDVERLAGPEKMGKLFKALALFSSAETGQALDFPPFLQTDTES